MDKPNNTPFIVILVLIAVIFVGVFLINKDGSSLVDKNQNSDQPENPEEISQNPVYKCGLTVNSPLPNSVVSFPLTLSGVVNNQASTDNCTWVLFEGQAGTVSISDGNTIYAVAPVSLLGDWMTSGPVNFSTILNPQVSIPSGTPLTITFAEENPSGEGISDTLSFSVFAQ